MVQSFFEATNKRLQLFEVKLKKHQIMVASQLILPFHGDSS